MLCFRRLGYVYHFQQVKSQQWLFVAVFHQLIYSAASLEFHVTCTERGTPP